MGANVLGQNGFWALRCVEGACSKCNNKTVHQIPNLVQSTPYLSKKTKVMKTSTQTVRQMIQKDVKTVRDELLNDSRKYLKHRFQIENDKYLWKIILHRNENTIFHKDYSENVSGSPKFGPPGCPF